MNKETEIIPVENIPKEEAFKQIVQTIIVHAKNNPDRIEGNVHFVSGTKFTFENKVIHVLDKKRNIKFDVFSDGTDIVVSELRNDDKKLKKLLNSSRWKSAVDSISKNLEEKIKGI
jgi:hypothetical protein